ncbi:MAG: hypothetical protein OXQ84_01795 [bacterium]|nr:hypothetical protein [bacterium]
MAVYAVFLNQASPSVWQALRDQWPNGRNYVLTDYMAFVVPEGIVTTQQISDAIGLGNESGQETLGIVFEWKSHGGFNHIDLWEWIDKAKSA